MADVVIFPEQTVQFEATEQPGAVYRVITPSPFVLVLGETYRVVLDGIAHVSTCVEFEGVPCIANVDDLYTEEMPPDGTFVIQHIPAGEISSDDAAIVTVIDRTNAPTHTLAIYQTAAVSNDVITENWDGSTEVHPGVESVSLETEDGGEKDFILADLVPETVEKTVALDFSGGDMTVAPEDGQVFSTVNIPKPSALIPENIAEGVNVAGIVGALAAGSGGGGVKIAVGTVSVGDDDTTLTDQRVETKHGFVPDYILAYCAHSWTGNLHHLAVGYSAALMAMTGASIRSRSWYKSGSSVAYKQDTTGGGITSTDGNIPIHSADENGFTFGNQAATGTWYYIIIGGLT